MVTEIMQRAAKMLYNGKCSVYRFSFVTDKYGISKQTREKVYEDVLCRISYISDGCAKESETVTTAIQKVKLFISPNYIVKSGDVINVEQNGRSESYKACGRIRFYSGHQEAELEIYNESV